jgi:putative Holliday junction resolvase
MRILALDYGSRRIGVALSDPTGTLARPLPFLPAKGDVKLAREIKAIAENEKAELILLGLPRHMNGSLGEAAEKVQAFGRAPVAGSRPRRARPARPHRQRGRRRPAPGLS